MKKLNFIFVPIVVLILTMLIVNNTDSIANAQQKKTAITDTIIAKVKIMEQDSILKVQALKLQQQDSTIAKLNIPVKPEPGSKPIQWLDYVIGLMAVIAVWAISFIPKLQKVNIPIIQRLCSETSSFIKSIQYICVGISALIPVIMGLDITSEYIKSILGNIEIVCLAIAGFTLFTTNKPELITPKKEEVKIDTTTPNA